MLWILSHVLVSYMYAVGYYGYLTFSEFLCPDPPPPAVGGEGSERIYSPEVTNYRCQNGFKWEEKNNLELVGLYLQMECLNKKWTPKKLPPCVRKCIMF